MARTGYLGPGWRLRYWRTIDGAEVDFILETPRSFDSRLGAGPIERRDLSTAWNPESASCLGPRYPAAGACMRVGDFELAG